MKELQEAIFYQCYKRLRKDIEDFLLAYPSLLSSIVGAGITKIKWSLVLESLERSKNRMRFLKTLFDEVQTGNDQGSMDNNFKCILIALTQISSETKTQFEYEFIEGAWKWGTTTLSSGNCFLATKVVNDALEYFCLVFQIIY